MLNLIRSWPARISENGKNLVFGKLKLAVLIELNALSTLWDGY